MPTYTIQLDDGRKVKVSADNPNAALAEANRFASSNPRRQNNGQLTLTDLVTGRRQNYVPNRAPATTGDKLQTLATQGVLFGQSPRVTGAMGAIMGVPNAVRQGSLAPIGEAYRQNRDAEVARIDAARRDTGLLGMVAETVGSVGPGAALARGAASVATRVAPRATRAAVNALAPRAGSVAGQVARSTGRVAAAATAGAAAGGLYGSGEGRAAENAMAGAVGGAAGLGVAKAAAGAGAIVQRLRNRYGRNVIPADRTAARAMLEQIERFGEQRVIAEMERLRRAGIRNPTLAEAIPGVARRVGSVARNDLDDARQLATRRAGGMVGDVPILAAEAAKKLSGRTGTVAARREQIGQRRRAIQDRMMEDAGGLSVEITPQAANALRTANLSRPMQSVENNLRTNAAVMNSERLGTEADLLRSLREGVSPQSGGAQSPAFNPAQTQDYANQMGFADQIRAGAPVSDRLPVIEFMKRAGGLRDTFERDGLSNWRARPIGEVENVLGRNNAYPGLINNKTGLTLQDMAERLRQAGYLGQSRIEREGATAASEAMQGGRIDDVVDLLDRLQRDPEAFRYGIDEDYLARLDEWRAAQETADQMGLTGRPADVRGRVSEDVYNQDMSPTSDAFLFEGVPSVADEGLPRRFDVRTVEALRDQISGAEGAALANPDQTQLAATLGRVRRELVDPVRQQVPSYDQTLKVGETFHRELDAMDLASGSGNKAGMAWNNVVPTEDVSQRLAGMTGRELRGYRLGAAQSLASKFNDGRLNVQLLEALGGRGLTQERVAAQFPVNRMQDLADTSNALVNRIEAARAINPNFGSQTASNLNADAMNTVEGFASLPMSKIGLVQRALNWVATNTGALLPAERVAIVDLGTKPISGPVADEILRITQAAQMRQGVASPNAMLPAAVIGANVGVRFNAAGTSQEYQR